MKLLPARPTIYNGIKMRSRLEAGYAAWLDRWGFRWEYEPHAFAGERGQYLPDFLVHDVVVMGEGPRELYVEVKPTPVLYEPDGFDVLLATIEKMRVIAPSAPDAVAVIDGPQPEDMHGAGSPTVLRVVSGPEDFTWDAWTWAYNGRTSNTPALIRLLEDHDLPYPWHWWET